MLKEKCVENYLEAIMAEKLGADRIELCDNLEVGGTTPSYGTIKTVLKNLKIPVFVIIRPRGGNFCYTSEEIEVMKEDIKVCKTLGVNGVVLGVLNEKNEINYRVLKELIDEAKPMSITFHKAIDELENPVKEVKKLSQLGVDRILTSGTKATAVEGKDIINNMIKEAGKEIIIVVAGKVTKYNFENITSEIIALEYHGRNIV